MTRSVRSRRTRTRFAVAVLVVVQLAACGPETLAPAPQPVAVDPPDPAAVESVLFLLGDAGEARTETSPVLARLREDVEWWSASLAADSSVALLVLGDIVYPLGLHGAETEVYHADTAVVMAQVRTVAGPAAVERGARAYFLAGNHDWGLREDREGFTRLVNLDRLLEQARAATGAAVYLAPEAGSGGPHVVDWGRSSRLLLLDTAWWLLRGSGSERAQVLAAVEEAIATAGDRHVMLAAHHPFLSAGPHGGQFTFWTAVGARYLLFRSGAILQDLTSLPYRELEAGLRSIFRRHGPPLAFFGGHDHSLQVIAGVEATDPHINLVSGSGSKLSRVGRHEGLVMGATAPGYMKVVIERGGGVSLYVEATEPDFLACPNEEAARVNCMTDGFAAFRTVHWQRLR